VEFRHAGPGDAEAVARLHAASWRGAYRGILSDEYLDGPIVEERLGVWRARLAEAGPGTSSPPDNQLVLLAEESGVVCGFVCAFLDSDTRWGAFLDNLHVLPAWQGRGLGKQLMSRAGAWVSDRRPGMGLYLLVFEENRPARAFYDALGGEVVERFWYHAADGTDLVSVRYWWADAGRLVDWVCRSTNLPISQSTDLRRS